MTIVETTVWIDYLRNISNSHTDWLDRNLETSIGLFDLILCEVLQGISNEGEFRDARAELHPFTVLPTGGELLAVAAAQNYRALRRRGVTVRKTVDCIIATACIRGGHSLLHHDRDYDAFEKLLGLRVIHP